MTVVSWCKGCDERITSTVDPLAFTDRIGGHIYCARCREEVLANVTRVPRLSIVPFAIFGALWVAIIAIVGWAIGWI